jgi:hypothetical protein
MGQVLKAFAGTCWRLRHGGTRDPGTKSGTMIGTGPLVNIQQLGITVAITGPWGTACSSHKSSHDARDGYDDHDVTSLDRR